MQENAVRRPVITELSQPTRQTCYTVVMRSLIFRYGYYKPPEGVMTAVRPPTERRRRNPLQGLVGKGGCKCLVLDVYPLPPRQALSDINGSEATG